MSSFVLSKHLRLAEAGLLVVVVVLGALLTVFVAVLLDLVGFGILIPVQPFLAESLDASPAIITLVGATYSAMQFIFAPLWGRLSDRIGRRPVMISSIAFGVCGLPGFGAGAAGGHAEERMGCPGRALVEAAPRIDAHAVWLRSRGSLALGIPCCHLGWVASCHQPELCISCIILV